MKQFRLLRLTDGILLILGFFFCRRRLKSGCLHYQCFLLLYLRQLLLNLLEKLGVLLFHLSVIAIKKNQ